jgi:hypothetical protein
MIPDPQKAWKKFNIWKDNYLKLAIAISVWGQQFCLGLKRQSTQAFSVLFLSSVLGNLMCCPTKQWNSIVNPDPDPSLFVRMRIWIRIRILPYSSKTSKKNLDFCCFVTSFYVFLSEKTDVKKVFFVATLKATDKKNRIRLWNRIRRSDPYQYVTDPQHCHKMSLLYGWNWNKVRMLFNCLQ